MISPGFFGIFNAHRALLTSQSALNTINHNIANANTDGYSRQRVDIQAAHPYTSPNIVGLNQGQLGQGSIVQEITRIRDSFLDDQFQDQNSFLGMNQQIRDILQSLEGIITEPSANGINSAIQGFFDAAQELSLNPESQAVRADFIQHASDMLTVFQQQAQQFYDLRTNITGNPNVAASFAVSQIGITVNDINNKIQTIASLNQQIVSIKASGAEPNDLYDQRNLLLDELAGLIDIDVQNLSNGQINVTTAGGTVSLISGGSIMNQLAYNMNPGPVPSQFDIPGLLTTTVTGVTLNDFAGSDVQSGKLKGLIDMGQYDAANPNRVNVRSALNSINTLFTSLAGQINTLQSTGRTLAGAVSGINLFVTGAATPPGDPIQILSWDVNAPFLDPINGPPLISAAINDPLAPPGPGFAGPGDGRNALAMAQLRQASIAALGNTTFTEFFNGVTSNLGISARTYQDRTTSQKNLINSLEQQRQSVSGVNTDEEMIDLLRFQRSFEASSKVISVFDEIYQTLINIT